MSWLSNISRDLHGRGVALNLTNYLSKKFKTKKDENLSALAYTYTRKMMCLNKNE